MNKKTVKSMQPVVKETEKSKVNKNRFRKLHGLTAFTHFRAGDFIQGKQLKLVSVTKITGFLRFTFVITEDPNTENVDHLISIKVPLSKKSDYYDLPLSLMIDEYYLNTACITNDTITTFHLGRVTFTCDGIVLLPADKEHDVFQYGNVDSSQIAKSSSNNEMTSEPSQEVKHEKVVEEKPNENSLEQMENDLKLLSGYDRMLIRTIASRNTVSAATLAKLSSQALKYYEKYKQHLSELRF